MRGISAHAKGLMLRKRATVVRIHSDVLIALTFHLLASDFDFAMKMSLAI